MINPGILVRETYYGNLIDQKNKKVKVLKAKINDVVYKDWGSDIQLDGLYAWRNVPDLANICLSSYPDMQYYVTNHMVNVCKYICLHSYVRFCGHIHWL